MKNKKAISAIVATVLIILVTIVAAGVVWFGISPLIAESIKFNEVTQDYSGGAVYSKLPSPNEANTIIIGADDAKEATLAPIVKVGKKEKTCSVTAKVTIPQCTSN